MAGLLHDLHQFVERHTVVAVGEAGVDVGVERAGGGIGVALDARALDANLYAAFSDGRHSVSFDRIVEVMKQTGHDLPSLYKETSQGGLAVIN